MTAPQQAPDVRQRQAASLVAGNTIRRAHEHARTDALEQHRAAVEGFFTPPTIRVSVGGPLPSFRGRCPYCAGTAFDLDMPPMLLDRPAVKARGVILCLLCSRTVAYLAIGESMTSEQFRALPNRQGKRGFPSRYSDDPKEANRLRMLAYRERQRMVAP